MADFVLIVDDDPAIRETTQEFLNIAKIPSATVSNAEAALEYLQSNSVDVVITDILMTGMDGLELTDIIKQTYNVEVIVITGFNANYSYEEAISKGASDFIFKPVRFEELLLRIKRVLRERKLSQDRAQMLHKLKKMAITDGLTKLFNSRYFYTQVEMEIDRLTRYKHPLALLLLDIDNFKEYNDKHSHLDGDRVLAGLGGIINNCLRAMDSAYRYGGEEFTILLPETQVVEAVKVAERIQRTLQETKFVSLKGDISYVTVSIGITDYSPNEELSAFVLRADKAMYISKAQGKNNISILTADD